MELDEFKSIVAPHTMTSEKRCEGLYNSLEMVRKNNIQGDFVECGVWKGGNVLGIIRYLESHGITDRNVWLYDTFDGMPDPTEDDVDVNNNKAEDVMDLVECFAPLKQVQRIINKNSTLYPREKIKYVVGDVCETLLNSDNVPDKIALLRLDTDWYASTKVELEVLWPKLELFAPCIIDDYGHWQGCKKAVHEFFEVRPCEHHFEHFDYTCVITHKVC